MKNQKEQEALFELGETVRGLLQDNQLEICEKMVRTAMETYPNAAQPHNLFGIILEKKGDHAGAMRHFRAAWALDPTFAPSRKNMDQYGSFCALRLPVYNETEGIGHVVKREWVMIQDLHPKRRHCTDNL